MLRFEDDRIRAVHFINSSGIQLGCRERADSRTERDEAGSRSLCPGSGDGFALRRRRAASLSRCGGAAAAAAEPLPGVPRDAAVSPLTPARPGRAAPLRPTRRLPP